MLFNVRILVTLCVLFQRFPVVESLRYDTFDGETDSSNYMFYDPTEECSRSSEPCITSFKYCSHSANSYQCPEDAKKDDNSTWVSTAYGSVQLIESMGHPLAVYQNFGEFRLTWQNANPDYPTTVTWRSHIPLGFYMYTGNIFFNFFPFFVS